MSEVEQELKQIRMLLEKLVAGQVRQNRRRAVLCDGDDGYRNELHKGEMVIPRPGYQ